MSERTPLLHYRLSASVSEPELRSPSAGRSPEQQPRRPSSRRQRSGLLHLQQQQQQTQKLSTFFGVVIPTLLSMFSVVVFLRIGEQKKNKKKPCWFIQISFIMKEELLSTDRRRKYLHYSQDYLRDISMTQKKSLTTIILIVMAC